MPDKINKLIKEGQYIDSKIYNLYQLYFSLLTGIVIGITGSILATFIFDFLNKGSFLYWSLFILIIILFIIALGNILKKLKVLKKAYKKSNNNLKPLYNLKEDSEK